jgi:hypothetical protein
MTFTGLDYICATKWVSYRRQELTTLHEHLSHPQFLVSSVLLIFLVFCVVILLCVSPCCVLSHDCVFYGLSMFTLFVSLLCLVPRLLCLSIITVWFPLHFFCVVILLCLSPCCVLFHDCFVYRLSMFDFPFTFSVLLFCFVNLSSVFCPTIALSIDYQCLISPSLFLCCYFALFVSLLCLVPRLLCLWIINVCFVCLPALSCPTIALSIDNQCLISPSLFSNVYLYVMLSIRFPSRVRCTRCHYVW